MSSKGSSGRSRWKQLGVALAVVAVSTAALAVFGLWWLARHPVSIGFLTPRIETALAKQVAPWSVELETLTVGWGGINEPLDLRAHNARIITETSSELITIGQLGIDLSAAALLRGKIEAGGVELIGTRVAIVRHQDGRFDFGGSDREPRTEEESTKKSFSLGKWLESSGVEELLSKLGRIELADGPVLTVQLSASQGAERAHGQLHAALDEVRVAQLGAFWPNGVAQPVETWITRHVPAGVVRDLEIDLTAKLMSGDAGQFALDSLSGSFAYQDLRLDLFPPQSPVTEVDGSATFSDQGFEFDVAGGRLNDLEIAASHVSITELAGPSPALALAAPLSGPAQTVVTFISSEPLSLVPSELLSTLTGQLTATLEMTIPLVAPINLDTMLLAAQAELHELVWPDAPGKLAVAQGTMALDIDNSSLALHGAAQFNDVPAEIEFREFFDGGELRRRVEARATVDQAGAKRLGIPEQSYFQAPADLDFGLEIDRNGVTRVEIDGELDAARRRLQLTEGRAHGRGFGITAEGWADFETKTLHFSGAVAPARSVQRVLGKIPLVSEILLGPREAGAFATLYEVSGPFADIQIRANPLSTITPGITREIFKLLPEDERPSDD